jgi:hypothetical protein
MEKWVVNIHSNIPHHDTCAKTERDFCEWVHFLQNPLLIFKNISPDVQKAFQKTMTKTGENRAFWQLLSN